MTALTWDETAKRAFETGISKGVLYPASNSPGTAWSGLTSVTHTTIDQDAATAFFDGVTYANTAMNGGYQATVSSLSIPDEFLSCLGEYNLRSGIVIPNQKRNSFGMCYRTEITGGYKLHLVYRAQMYRSKRTNTTLSDGSSVELLNMLIAVSAQADLETVRSTGHYILDSRYTPDAVMAAIEASLYGGVGTDPTLLSPSDILTIFSA